MIKRLEMKIAAELINKYVFFDNGLGAVQTCTGAFLHGLYVDRECDGVYKENSRTRHEETHHQKRYWRRQNDKGIIKGCLNSLADTLERDGYFTLVIDNVRFHHVPQGFRGAYQFEFAYLPCSKPFLNPCEEGRMKGTEDLVSIMENAITQVSRY
ncbi:hypothetical protein RF11_02846 [Thelohanellus kitauei]|uniref:Uncharacterized protein n=1 Tax=Thelohanellus kitauei TaxID=669202 RepID=A0A0C2J0Y2_THEKT|nr:hypothetical protein RF11_02846 [Thelohanellus kitauei]